jgi:hypothetical protein
VFFLNVYNEDWLFVSKEATNHRNAEVGVSALT